MEELPVTEIELKQLLKTVDKITNPTLYNKIARKYNKYAKTKVKLFRKISKIARKEKELEEELCKGFVRIPDWLFTELPVCTTFTSIESVTIDMIRMLRGDDKKKMLAAWHDWKARQKAVDVQYAKREKARICRMQAIRKDPEGFYARQRRYHEQERLRHFSDPEWLAKHRHPRKKLTLEEIKAKRKAYLKRRYNDPIRKAKIKLQKHLEYVERHKDIPGWLEKHERRQKRHQELLQLGLARAQRREARRAKKLALGQKRIWTIGEKKEILRLVANENLERYEIRERMNLTQKEMYSLLAAARYEEKKNGG